MALSPDGRVAAGTIHGSIFIWDARTGVRVGTLLGHQNRVRGLAFTPDGRILLSGANDGVARIWDLTSMRPIGSPIDHGNVVRAVAISPDGQLALSGGKTVRSGSGTSPRPGRSGSPSSIAEGSVASCSTRGARSS